MKMFSKDQRLSRLFGKSRKTGTVPFATGRVQKFNSKCFVENEIDPFSHPAQLKIEDDKRNYTSFNRKCLIFV